MLDLAGRQVLRSPPVPVALITLELEAIDPWPSGRRRATFPSLFERTEIRELIQAQLDRGSAPSAPGSRAPIARKLLQRIRARDIPITATSESAASAIHAPLDPTELGVFSRLASGNSNQDIARERSLSTNTISNQFASIPAKLRLDNRIQAVRSGSS